MIRCSVCNTQYPPSHYYYRKNRNNYDRQCKACRTKQKRRPDRLRKYGLQEGDFTELLKAQGYECAICCAPIDQSSDIDHDHDTGKVRGILCRTCNRGLGLFEDNKELIYQAYQYL